MEKYLEIQDEERIIDDAHSPRSITGQTQQGQDGDDAGSPQSVPGKKRVRTDDDSEDEAGEDVDAPGETRTSKGEEGQEQKQKKSGTTARTPASSETREHEVDDEPGSTPTVETPEEEKTRGVEGDDKAGSTPAAATQKEEKVEERKTRKPAPSKPRKTEKTQEGLRGDESGSSATGGQPYRETHKEKGGHTPEHGENPAASPKPSQARGNEKGRAKPREEKKKTTSSKKGQTSVEGEKRHQEAQGKDKSPLSGETHDAAATEAAGDEKLAASDGQHQTVKDEKGSAPQQEAAQKSQRWTRRHRESQKVEGQVPLSGAPSDEIQISDSDGSHRAEKDEKSSAAQQETAREVSREKKSRDSASDEKRNRESQDVEGQVPLSDKTHDAAAAEAAGDEKQIAASDGKHQTVKDEKGSAPQQEAAQEVTREKKSRTSASGEKRHRGSKGAEGQVPLPDKTHDAAATEAAGEEKQTAASDGKHQTVKDEKGSAPQQEAAQKVKREKKSRTSASGEKRHRGSKGAEGQVSQPGTTHAPVTATTTAAANAAGGEIQLPPSESRQQAANEENKAHQEKTQEVERRKKSRASAASKQRQSVDSQVPRSGTTHSAATAAAGDEIQTPRPLVDSEHQATKNERHPVPVQDKTSKGERGKKSRKETHEAAAGDESGSIRSDRQQEAKKSVESAIPTSADERKKLDESEGSRASAPSEPHEEGVREDDAQVIANADRARLRSTSASSRRLSEAVSHEPKPHGEWAHLKWYCDKEKVPAKTDLCFYGIQRSAAGQLGYVFRSKEDTVPFKVGPFGTVTHVSDELRAFFKATRKESVEVGWILREIKINRKATLDRQRNTCAQGLSLRLCRGFSVQPHKVPQVEFLFLEAGGEAMVKLLLPRYWLQCALLVDEPCHGLAHQQLVKQQNSAIDLDVRCVGRAYAIDSVVAYGWWLFRPRVLPQDASCWDVLVLHFRLYSDGLAHGGVCGHQRILRCVRLAYIMLHVIHKFNMSDSELALQESLGSSNIFPASVWSRSRIAYASLLVRAPAATTTFKAA
eukprot:TRINITY_DN2670_c0_g1_i4.p1 TRINITY_DN2670_c0_g1~~TRINITY_DN2670_c0_g1_i4.p1  ORF type:complete len:1101 (-),score=164.01 TRINITY_DN2670_c0_g1_i4:227-3352(-)